MFKKKWSWRKQLSRTKWLLFIIMCKHIFVHSQILSYTSENSFNDKYLKGFWSKSRVKWFLEHLVSGVRKMMWQSPNAPYLTCWQCRKWIYLLTFYYWFTSTSNYARGNEKTNQKPTTCCERCLLACYVVYTICHLLVLYPLWIVGKWWSTNEMKIRCEKSTSTYHKSTVCLFCASPMQCD